jgi:hypothetical protein
MVWTDSWSSIVGAVVLVQVKCESERSMPCEASEEWRDK